MIGRRALFICLLVIGVVFASGKAHADTITYALTGTFSGPTIGATLGGVSLANEAFAFTFVGDTSLFGPGIGSINWVPVSGTFDIGGTTGTFNMTNAAGSPIVFGYNTSLESVGFNYSSYGAAVSPDSSAMIFDITGDDPSYTGDNSTIGALSVIGSSTGSGTFATSAGNLSIAPGDGTNVTFTATVLTPEPGTFSLMLIGIGLVLVMRKRIAQGLRASQPV